MSAFVLSEAQLDQLQELKALGALSEAKACWASLASNRLNGGMIVKALVPKGLVGRKIKRAQYGDPQRTLYWLTEAGLALLAEQEARERGVSAQIVGDAFAYDVAQDVAEQLP